LWVRESVFLRTLTPSDVLTHDCLCPLRVPEDVLYVAHAPTSFECSPPVTLTSVKTILHAKVSAGRCLRVRLGVGLGEEWEGEEGEESGLGRAWKRGGGAFAGIERRVFDTSTK